MDFFKRDIGVLLKFPCLAQGTRLDLSSATDLSLLVEDNPNSPFTLTVDPSKSYLATYAVQANDFNPAQEYLATVRVTYSPTRVFHSKTIVIKVSELYAFS